MFELQPGDWPQPGRDPAHTSYNPNETALSPDTVSGLRLAWTGTTGPGGTRYSSSPAIADGGVYVGSEDGTLYAFAVGCASAGVACSPLWTGTTGGRIASSPAVADGVVYVTSADGKLYAFAVGCASGGATCAPLWTGRASFLPVAGSSSPVVAEGVVYLGSFDGKLYAFEVGCGTGGATCSPLWTGTTHNQGSGLQILGSSSPAVADGVVYVGSDHAADRTIVGTVYAFAVGCASDGRYGGYDVYDNVRTCTPLWTGTTDDSSWLSSPVVADGEVYVGSGQTLYAFAVDCGSGGATCSPLWTGTIRGRFYSPAVADGVVYADSYAGQLYAFAVSCADGGAACSPLWTGSTGRASLSSPVVANGVVYTGSKDGGLYAFAVGCASGGTACTPLWTGRTGDARLYSSPVVADGVVYVSVDDGKLYAFALEP